MHSFGGRNMQLPLTGSPQLLREYERLWERNGAANQDPAPQPGNDAANSESPMMIFGPNGAPDFLLSSQISEALQDSTRIKSCIALKSPEPPTRIRFACRLRKAMGGMRIW